MGCASPTLLGAGQTCATDEVSSAIESNEIDEVQIKVPTFRPTPTVQSVLGLLPGEYSEPVGTSIQLLPPAPLLSSDKSTASPTSGVPREEPAAAAAAKPVPPPMLVTQEIAKLGKPQLSWQPRGSTLQPPTQHVAAQPTRRAAGEHAAGAANPDTMTEVTKNNLPSLQNAGQESMLTASRRGYPAWIEPEQAGVAANAAKADVGKADPSQDAWRPRGTATQPQPLRDPLPELAPPPKITPPSAVKKAVQGPITAPVEDDVITSRQATVGSGLPKRAPVQATPTQEKRPAWTTPSEQLPTLDELPDHPDPKISKPTAAKKTDAHDGNNEGVAEGPLDVDDWDGAAVREMKAPEDSAANLSTIDIQPLVIDTVETLRAAEDTADLRDIQGQQDRSIKGLYVPQKTSPKPSMGQTIRRDATGREKTHAGSGAVAELSPAIARLQQPILQTLRSFHARTEQADARSNWGMMHAIMVYGTDTRIIARRRNYSAIAWMAGNNVCRGNRLMTTERGNIKIREGTGLQGHQAQWLATLSLASVPANYPLYADNKRFTIEDLVQVEAAACEDGKELTFTLIGLAHYLDTNSTWEGVGGEHWDFERLIAAELDQPIVGAACGGTHRLMGFAHALRKRRLESEPIEGQWKRAEKFLDDFVQYSYTLQNRDGSFSTNWFESPEDNGDLSRKVQTTGHILEFLLTHLPDEEVVNDRVVSAVRFLTAAMRRVDMDDAGVGYRAHALRSLAMFHQRAYGTAPVYPPGQMAFGQHRNQHQR